MMAVYDSGDLLQNDVKYVEMRFEARTSSSPVVLCGTHEYELAPLRTRLIAAAIDLALLTVTELAFSGLFGALGLVFSLLFLLVFQWYFLSERFGQTPGKMIMNIFVVRHDGEFPTARDALLRTMGYVLNVASLGLGWLLIAADKREQGFHDKLANTYVVKS
jgi:uncharacterized RDD family membrane protein YckC